jgi:hypothetical protein
MTLTCALLASTSLRAESTDVVGYFTCTLMPGQKGAMQVNMVNSYRMKEAVVGVGSDHVEFAIDIPPDIMGAGGSAFLEIRSGPGQGSTIPVSGFSGRRLDLARSPLGLVLPGNIVSIRPDWTLDELFFSALDRGIVAGQTHASADTIGIFDASTQRMKVYFFKTGQGWRQVGKEHEGDKANDPVPFPTAPVYHRRGAEKLDFAVVGAVPMPYEGERTVFVWPGRNLVSLPFTSSTRMEEFFHSEDLTSRGSAPASDTWRFHYQNGGSSPVIYLRHSERWRYVGGGDAAEQPIELGQALDLQRRGAAGYLRFNGIRTTTVRAVRAATGQELPIDRTLSDFPAGVIGWKSIAGRRYQVQTRPSGESEWSNHGEALTAVSASTRHSCQLQGSGLIRVLALP